MVAQETLNFEVAGSSPVIPTRRYEARHQTPSSVMNCTVPCVFPISTSKANKNRSRVPFVQRKGHLTTDQETGVQIFYGTPIGIVAVLLKVTRVSGLCGSLYKTTLLCGTVCQSRKYASVCLVARAPRCKRGTSETPVVQIHPGAP